MHRLSRSQRTSRPQTTSVDFDHANDDADDEENVFDTTQIFDANNTLGSGLTESERIACLLHDKDGGSGKLQSILTLCIGTRVMMTQNVDLMLGLVNGTTGTIVGFIYSTVLGSNQICPNPRNYATAARLEPQIPIVLVRVDEEFWGAPKHNFFDIPPPLEGRRGNWERVIAVPPVESQKNYQLNFSGGRKKVTRIQLPLIPAFALTVHKSQGLNKNYVLFVASSKLFARAITYVALSRCTTLEGLYIVGRKITTQHFKQTFGNEDSVIRAQTARLRKFQGNTLTKGQEAVSKYQGKEYNSEVPIIFEDDEPEFDKS